MIWQSIHRTTTENNAEPLQKLQRLVIQGPVIIKKELQGLVIIKKEGG